MVWLLIGQVFYDFFSLIGWDCCRKGPSPEMAEQRGVLWAGLKASFLELHRPDPPSIGGTQLVPALSYSNVACTRY